ncbi:MAG: hypothetical protein AABZ01_04465, partial [Gemmatimonadota bacterium]
MSPRIPLAGAALLAVGLIAAAAPQFESAVVPRFVVTYGAERSPMPLDGRLLLMISSDTAGEPRFQVSDAGTTQLIFGIDVDAWAPGAEAAFDESVIGYPIDRLGDLPPGRYRVQALLNRYQTYHRSDGHIVKLPPDRGEGQQWNRKPGNLYSTPRMVVI